MVLNSKITQDVKVVTSDAELDAFLSVPDQTQSIVLFAHGSGSSRYSERNQFVASELNNAGIATLLIDLLTTDEEIIDTHTGHLRFDIDLLTQRVLGATQWLKQHPATQKFSMSYFGASTGAAAALKAAANEGNKINAVVSRGGRPDLAKEALSRVKSPTLLIVGGNDIDVLAMNQEAFAALKAPKELKIVPGATHLFEEPGALEQVAHLATDWFLKHV